MMGGEGGPKKFTTGSFFVNWAGKYAKLKTGNICQTNVYGMLGVGTEGPKWI